MAVHLSSVVFSRLEKCAVDNGFDRELPQVDGWLAFGSTQCSLRIWLRQASGGGFVAAFSKQNVTAALADYGQDLSARLPPGASAARKVQDIPALHHLLRRAFQLGRSLPDELLQVFQAQTAVLPRTTEAERLVVQRVGQDIFRAGLMEYWEGRCAISGLAVPELLRASHIKPWAACESDAERLDVFNGFLLAPHLDAAFDQGFFTISDDGEVIVSPALDPTAREILAIGNLSRSRVRLTVNHRDYLVWHRERVFRKSAPALSA